MPMTVPHVMATMMVSAGLCGMMTSSLMLIVHTATGRVWFQHARYSSTLCLHHHPLADLLVMLLFFFLATCSTKVAAKLSCVPSACCANAFALLTAGYFSSRATSKGYVRYATAYLNAARQLQALQPAVTAGGSSQEGHTHAVAPARLDPLEAAVSLTQHHDAITGTAKQAVANDYARCVDVLYIHVPHLSKPCYSLPFMPIVLLLFVSVHLEHCSCRIRHCDPLSPLLVKHYCLLQTATCTLDSRRRRAFLPARLGSL